MAILQQTILSFTLLALVVAEKFPLRVVEPRNDVCPTTGPRCTADCKDIILCLTTEDTEPIHVATCPEKKFCSEDPSGEPNCNALFCNIEPFHCTTPGAVPNPLNSSSYYLCPGINTVGFLTPCTNGTYFDTKTLACDVSTGPTYEPVECDAFAKSGQIGTDNRFCYICDELYQPLVYLCSLKDPNTLFIF